MNFNANEPPQAFSGGLLVEQHALDEAAVCCSRAYQLVSTGEVCKIPISAHPQTQSMPDRDLGFYRLLEQVLRAFSDGPMAQVERKLRTVSHQICQFLRLDRAWIWRGNAEQPASFTWTPLYPFMDAAAAPATPENPKWQAPFPWLWSQLRSGKSIALANVLRLPGEAEAERQGLNRLGIGAFVLFPIEAEGKLTGAIGFGLRQPWQLAWPDFLVKQLKLVAQIVGQGIARQLKEEKLNLALTQATQFKNALDAHAGVAVASAEGLITFVNDGYCRLCKYSREELVGCNRPLLDSGLHSPDFFHQIRTIIAQDGVWRGEIKNQAKDNSLYWVDMTIAPFPGQGWKSAEYISISVDITERKLAEEALSRSYADIKLLKDQLEAESEYLKTEIKLNQAHRDIVGRSYALRRVLQQVEQVAPVDCSVLITGETGTGKELIAQAIHRLSSRKDRLMVSVNCAALPGQLIESELFGRERGAFTGALNSAPGRFELADGSTIFLDEIGELSLELQAKLLRVLQEGEFQRLGSTRTRKVNLRVITATNKDLAREVREGRFREDLYYRLRVFPLHVPPLRERAEDIPLLVSAFVQEFSNRMSKPIKRIPIRLIETLQHHSWPGNIRELRNVIERGVILSTGEVLVLPNLREGSEPLRRPTSLEEVERDHILKTLKDAGWRVKGPFGAAKRLQLNPSTLYSRMAKLGIQRGMAESGSPDLEPTMGK